jgi:hypothetical protein
MNHVYDEYGRCFECDKKAPLPYRFGNWTISYWAKPIPDRQFDYDFVSDEYDGENGLAGNASSLTNAIHQINEIEEQNNEN